MKQLVNENYSLKPHNTFGIDVSAKLFTTVESLDELQEVLSSKKYKDEQKLVLGGGSNILLTKDQDALVIHNKIKGIVLEQEDEEKRILSVGSGEVWHDFVLYSIEQGYGGLENLSLIPGSVGASPMQNIGAYGVEIKDRFEWLDALHIATGEVHRFYHKDCNFGYRESVFKNKHKGEYIITKVAYNFPKNYNVNTSYGAIQQELEKNNIGTPTIKDVSNAVINIRKSKLPDPKNIGNSGSFFKNPVIPNEQLEYLKKAFPNIVSYPVNESQSKVAAGWLIDNDGWKGKSFGRYGVHKNQALVLVNYGGATGNEILALSDQIIRSVKDKFGIELEREVNVL